VNDIRLRRARLRLEPESYEEVRRPVLQRDGWRCQSCGAMSNLEVHHKRFRSRSGDDSEQNLITLCTTCHAGVHLTLKAGKLHIYSDREVVVRQMKGEYICHSPRLYSLNCVCRKLARSFDFSISRVRRGHNTEANRLANSNVRKHLFRSQFARFGPVDVEEILPRG
jgi:hypothetical protein